MKSAILTGNGEVHVQECEMPIPGEGEAVVKVALSSLCGTDNDCYKAARPTPRPSGHEFTGQIATIGPKVERFSPGDRVVAAWGIGCGSCQYCDAGRPNLCDSVIVFDGTHADYIRVPQADEALANLPDELSYQAGIVMACSLSTGAYGVEMSAISTADTVMVLGLGAVGLSMVLSAVPDKPEKIVGVDAVKYRRDKAVQFGAHEVGDPADEQWLQSRQATADVVLIATANPKAIETAVYMARKGGRIVVIGSQVSARLPFERFDQYGLHLFGTWSMLGGDYMRRVVESVVLGRIERRQLESMVTHVFPLAQIKKAYELFSSYSDGVIKIAVRPSPEPGSCG